VLHCVLCHVLSVVLCAVRGAVCCVLCTGSGAVCCALCCAVCCVLCSTVCCVMCWVLCCALCVVLCAVCCALGVTHDLSERTCRALDPEQGRPTLWHRRLRTGSLMAEVLSQPMQSFELTPTGAAGFVSTHRCTLSYSADAVAARPETVR